MNISNIHERIRQLRVNKGLKSIQVSNKTGINYGTISSYETGKAKPSLENILILANFYGTTADYILTGKEPKIIDPKKTHMFVPVVARVHAGEPCRSFEEIIRQDALPITKANKQIECGVMIDGDCMEPTFYDGDVVYISHKFDPAILPNNSIVIARVGDENLIRRYRRTNSGIVLLADNQEYDPIVPNGKGFRVIARVLSWFHNHAAQFE